MGEREGLIVFNCEQLHCRLLARVCVMRQAVSDAQRRSVQRYKGEGLSYPHCVAATCLQGRTVQQLVDPDRAITWSGDGPGGRFDRAQRIAAKRPQLEAMDRARRAGLLDSTPTLDSPPPGVPPEDDGPEVSEQAQAATSKPDRAPQGRRPASLGVPAGPVWEPGRPAEGPRRVPRDGPREGDRARDEVPPRGREGRRLQVGGDPARLRVGQAEPGRRGDRQGRRAARGLGCP